MLEETKNMASETFKDVQEVVKERFYSPMYFYFIIAWIITNWKFVFALFFVDQEDLYTKKINYLISFYSLSSFGHFIWTVSKLVLIPALSSYLFVWWFSRLAELFYGRNATFKYNKIAIQRRLVYEDKVKIAQEQREIREAESDKKELRYIDYEDFNSYLDDGQENISVLGLEYLPSEVLYGTDPESYKEKLNEYLAEINMVKEDL